MNRWKSLLAFVLIAVSSSSAFAQQQTATPNFAPSSKYRTIFTPVGAVGGFTLGVFAGMVKFEDSVNSDRKVWTTAIVSGAGGAVGGYFLGRVLDRHRDNARLRSVQAAPLLSADTKGVQFSIRF